MLVGRRSQHRSRGFTLIELVTTITVMAILAGIALPSFSAFIASQRIRNVSFDLMAAITLARSQAVTRNGNVSLQKIGTAWDGGWKVSDGTLTFHNQEAYKNLSITDSAGLGAITYGKDGRTVTAGTRFTIAPATAVSGVSARCVSIGLSGVPSSSTGAC
jgi:type IV fimbrial biogenesis protein FimT